MDLYLHYSVKLIFIIMMLFYLCKIAASDILQGKIKNIHILRILEISIAYLFILVFCKALNLYHVPITLHWIKGYLIFILISIAISLALWRVSVWPAGDSKLHIAVSAAVPLVILNASLGFHRQFCILTNIFLPAAAAFMAEAIIIFFAEIRTRKLSWLTDGINKENISKILGATFIFLLCRYVNILVLSYVNFTPAMQFVFLFFLWPLLSGLFNNIIVSLLLVIAMTTYGFIAYSSSEAIINSLICLGYALPLMALRYGVRLLMKRDSVFSIKPENLSEGVMLTDNYLEKIKKSSPEFYKETFGLGIYPEGLTANQAEALKKLTISLGQDSVLMPIEARKGKAFAEWIIFGAVLTCLLCGNNLTSLFLSFMNMYFAR